MMHKELVLDDILNFQKKYKNKNNLETEKIMIEKGIQKACLNENLVKEYPYQFNLEIPEIKIYNQKNSCQCNIYAFFRTLKSILITEKPSRFISRLDLSANYLEFYDKLEKANTLYNVLIEEENITLESINNKVNQYIGIYGTFHFCRELLGKYGAVPTEVMPEVNENYNAFTILELLKAKIKTDATFLIGKNKEEKQKQKKALMQEVYVFLSKVLGNPPTEFNYKGEYYTPITFKEKFLACNLEDYITVTSYDENTFFESHAFIPNVYLSNKEIIETLSMDKIKEVAKKQLEDGIAIWFSAEESTTLDYDINILDTHTYKYSELLNIKNLPKNQKILLDITNYDHAMCITGAQIEKKEVKRWKVDNSFGKHGKSQGHLIMTNSFFENCIITLIINKKYL